MKYHLLSDLVDDSKYDSLNINEKRDVVKLTEDTIQYRLYKDIINTNVKPVDKLRIFYVPYLKIVKMALDIALEYKK